MTLDDAIKHAEEVAYQKNLESGFDTDNERYAMSDNERANCKKCADEHRQLAEWLEDYKRLLEQQPSDCVSLEVYKQIAWERDIAIEQLKELGYSFGEKIRTSDDCVSRQPILEELNRLGRHAFKDDTDYDCLFDFVDRLSPVIPTQSWIPIVTREPTEEEKEYYFEQNGEELCYMIDSPMPNNGQEVLVSVGSLVSEDVFDEDFWDFENCDIENVDAWMPLPQPYEEKRGNENENN